MNNKELTHLNKNGVHMVEVGQKPLSQRTATAQGTIHLQKTTIQQIQEDKIKKGNVLTVAQIAAITSIKNTSQIIPLCHPLNITGIEIEFTTKETTITTTVTVNTQGQTGVEMEAITGASTALLTIWDMVKSIEKDENGQYPNTRITDIIVTQKTKKEI